MVTYVATLDVPRHVVDHLSRLLAAHRRRLGTPRGSRALGPFRQAVLVLRWFREQACVHCLARDAGVSQATGYRYLHEGIDALAAQAPDLHDVLNRCRREGMTHVILDGTLIESDRLAGVRDNGNDLWFSQKHKAFGGNVQFLSSPNGTPLWVSDVEPGSTPDITAARIHVLPVLYKAAADGLPTLADKGYIGAGIGIHIPVRRPQGRSEQALHTDTRTTNTLIRDLRALGERAAAELKERWRALKKVSLSPSRIGDIARAALVLNGILK
ncbi:transposase family protein [Streptomyces sp. TS71-3]|uniref:transposase family protein n=1 Tax=Streptomyces sp. TS71-3 TaxID=2733862 RepID=UPI001B1DCE9C|nr:transposase family protein [Streptomyces sp. TS71-3]GHJ34639.1 transposase [Streptomyces sp. TS71-3]GHJ35212.1 transposase [Streptomyces sp. TS71-3]GHJ35483.1 transposase [Streptomyces sp. TS71-3]GHJ35897.1 transposase [Streptomyces sp. TS71-3]GHJ37267.1 transposase [Streptomyces sp. TS71-3]